MYGELQIIHIGNGVVSGVKDFKWLDKISTNLVANSLEDMIDNNVGIKHTLEYGESDVFILKSVHVWKK